MPKTMWCKVNGISYKQFFYWQRILRQEVYQHMESQSSSLASSALVPDVKEEKAFHPAFVEIRSVTSKIESSTFRPDVIIHFGNLTVEIANTASEDLLRKLRGLFMFNDATGFKRIFLKVAYTDLRKEIPGLTAMIRESFGCDLYKKNVLASGSTG